MKSFTNGLLCLAALAGTALAQNSTSSRNDTAACAALASLAPQQLANLTIEISAMQQAGLVINDTLQGGYNPSLGGPYNAMCRFRANIRTSAKSSVLFELFMPESTKWNGDFMMVGNGGVAGFVVYNGMTVPLNKYGYAVASTNTGHNGSSGNGTFLVNNTESAIDFGYRAVHLTTVYSKAITNLFYGRNASLAFWSGCSSGGKQGLKEIEMFPADYDAAIVGSAAQPWPRLNGWTQYVNQLVNPVGSAGYIAPSAWTAINKEVLNQCDLLDGVADGIILEPGKCFLNFTNFGCSGNSTALNSTSCLSSAQLTTLQAVYRNWTDPSSGQQIFPAFNAGSEYNFAGSVNGIPYGPAPSYFLYQILNVTTIQLPFETPNLTINGSTPTQRQLIDLVYQGDRLDPGGINANNPNISTFLGRGGKLIMFVGLADWLIPTNTTHDYYANVRSTLGNVSNSVVFYDIPGMGHCNGGTAAWNLGLPNQTPVTGVPLQDGPQYDMHVALRQWRVNGTRPGTLIGANYVANNVSRGVAFTRKICQYPLVGRYSGTGNITDQASYECRA